MLQLAQEEELLRCAAAPGKDISIAEIPSVTEYETFKDGTKAFEKNLTEHTIAELSENPDAYHGERIRISVRVKEVTFTEDGLGILCTYNPPVAPSMRKRPCI